MAAQLRGLWRKNGVFRSTQRRTCFKNVFFSSKIPKKGLFDCSWLHRPEDLTDRAYRVTLECQEITKKILEMKPSPKVLDLMDEISDKACEVIDLAECCRTLHTDKSWIQAADQAFLYLSQYLEILNTSPPCYQVLCSLSKHKLSSEQQMMLKSLKLDMEKSGIHLNESDRQKATNIQNEINELSSTFQANIFAPTRLHIETSTGLSAPSFTQMLEINRYGGPAEFPSDQTVVNEILSWTPSAETRRQVYKAFERSVVSNEKVLEKLVRKRYEYAQLAGFQSHAHLTMSAMMAESPERVLSQLDRIAKKLRPRAKKEIALISEQKKKEGLSGEVYPWDTNYYMGKLKANKCSIDAINLSHYFSLKNCFRGLKILTESLFGCELREVEMEQSETWVSNGADIHKFNVHDMASGKLIATIHMDLFQRVNKGGAACFAISCAKVNKDGGLRIPKVVLTCNFSSSRREQPAFLSAFSKIASSTSLNPSPSDILLRHHEFETLLHEFGHALHLVFSRTKFQNLSGFRGPLDFVETPSNLMEFFAWDHRFLRQFAHHNSTGNVIPEDLVRRLKESKTMFRALDTLGSVLRSKVDLLLFGKEPLSRKSQADLVQSVMKSTIPIKMEESPLWHTRFEHFSNYAGGYYTYLYGQMFAQQIWKKGFSDDPLNSENGHKYRTLVLEPGASKEPAEILSSYLNNDLNIDIANHL